jgi:glucuronate isomerase
MMVFFGHLDAKARLDQAASPRRAAQQQHRLLKQLGPDTGFDSIGDFPQARRSRPI